MITNTIRTHPSAAPLARNTEYDVVVIGGGAAGLSGALALARSRRTVLVIDDGQPRNAPANHMHNYLTRDGTPPAELVAVGRAEVLSYGGEIMTGCVTTLERITDQKNRDGFRVVLDNGTSFVARRLLVATGLVDELPDLPGVAEGWGRDVLHCAYCHGWEVRDQAIGILGTGPMLMHQALLFRQLSADVVVFQHTAPRLTDEQREQLTARNIMIVEGEVAALEIDNDQLVGVRLRSGEFTARQAMVVTPRFAARAAILDMLGLATTAYEIAGHVVAAYVAADANGATSVPGVWVAGNVADPMAQVIGAAAAGLKAGAAINADLVMEETARAVADWRAQQ